jgi:outer membrane protein
LCNFLHLKAVGLHGTDREKSPVARVESVEGANTVKRERSRIPGLILGLLFFCAGPLTPLVGQDVEGTLTLRDAIRLARGHNPAFLSTQNDVGPADWNVREAYGLFLPDFTTSISGQYLAPGSPSFGIFDAGDLGLDVTDYYFSGYSLTATYSLSGASLFRVASARAARNATDARIQAASFTLESDVTAQYLIALRARDGVEVARRQLDRAEQSWELADARVEVGATTPTDGKQAEVERGRAEIDLLEAESLLRTEKVRLLEQLGVEAEGEFQLASEFELFEPAWDRQELVARALERHPQLTAFRAQENASKATARQAWSNYLPNVFVSANWSGRAREIGDTDYLLNQANGSLASAQASCERWNATSAGLAQPLEGYPRDCSGYVLTPDQEAAILSNNDVFPFNFRKEPWSLYVQVSFPVFQGFGRQRQVAEAKSAAEDARLDRAAEELRIQTAVTQAYDELLTATQVVTIEARNREVAEEQLELAQERYRLGASSFLELLEAQSSMATAERDHLNARYRFHGAIWALEAAVGERLRPDVDLRQ